MARKTRGWRLAFTTWMMLSGGTATFADEAPARADLGFLLGEAVSAAEPIPGADDSQPAQRELRSALTRRSVRVADVTGRQNFGRPAVVVDAIVEPATEPVLDDADAEAADQTFDAVEPTWEPKPEVIQERYPNRKIRIEREVTQDSRGNYLNHGSWKMWDIKGNLMAEGQFVDGERQGTWYRWHHREDSDMLGRAPYDKFAPPFVSQATFQNGELHRAWILFDAKQVKISEWNFAEGKRAGKSTWWHANGQKMREIDYKDGVIDGEILEWNDAAQLITKATFQNGRKLAPRTEWFREGVKKSEGTYLHAAFVVKTPDDWWNALPAQFVTQGKDERHGEWMSWYESGQEQMRGKFMNDKEDGAFIWWYPNGQKAVEGQFIAGRQQGDWTWWHKNGQKATVGKYVSGEQTGRWTVWNENGKVTQASEHNEPAAGVVESTDAPTNREASAAPTSEEGKPLQR